MSEAAPIAAHPMQATVMKRVQQYRDVRTAIDKMDEEHEARRKPLLETKEMLAGWLQTFLENAGADSVKTEAGTVHFTTRTTTSLADPEAFMKFVIDNQQFELLDRRANATAVKAFVEERNCLPPGCNLHAIKTVGVKKPTGK